MSLLSVKNLKKVYGRDFSEVTALDSVSFEVDAGEFVAIVGTSGSGKSTLLHIIGGIDTPTSGEVTVCGIKVHGQSERELTLYRRDKVAVIYQSYNLLPMLNVRDNITLPSELAHRSVDREAVEKMMKKLGILEKEYFYPNQLSGGQQQRVAICRALMSSPALLLADEPTGNLDSANSESIMEVLRQSNRELSQTVIVVTHDDRIAAEADRIIRLEDGRIVRDEMI